jgi:DNA-binding beta-propeller fold protein YncE
VADPGRKSVVMFDNFGLYLADIGKDSLRRPIGVAVSPEGDRIYAVEADGDSDEAHGIVAFDKDGNKLFAALGRGGEPGQFNLPVSAAVGKDGAVYVLDSGNFRVQKLSPEGKVVKTWGGVGNRSGQLARPRDIAADAQGNVYVSDSAFGAIQIFDPDGRLLMDMGAFGLNGGPGEFAMLAGIGVDETGRVYAVDQVNRAVTVFRPTGS